MLVVHEDPNRADLCRQITQMGIPIPHCSTSTIAGYCNVHNTIVLRHVDCRCEKGAIVMMSWGAFYVQSHS